ncbi:DUF4167 domain-containing protein [Roseovarius sp.]|uniref:DUF4167 domain-containing protein n=1 Tax=Roseovarius sp. TaxID=1486281 RepID=UPI003BA972A7
MRSSKSRSRNKSNRNRSMGNVVNRVFDSSGPEGKVRGTPQQVIDKYNQLARDAQLAGDRVAAENFQQHAEHYLRLLGSAQKEQDAKREEQERQNRERQAERDRERAKRQEREMNGGDMVEDDQPSQQNHQPQGEGKQKQSRSDVLETTGDEPDSGLVETPESKSGDTGGQQDAPQEKPKRTRKPRTPKPKASDGGGDKGPDSKEAAE